MAFPIGFFTHPSENTKLQEAGTTQIASVVPKKSLVQIAFPGRGMNLTYFNDQFDLHNQFDGSYFAAISKGALFKYAIDAMVSGKVSFTDTSIASYIPKPIETEDDDWDSDDE